MRHSVCTSVGFVRYSGQGRRQSRIWESCVWQIIQLILCLKWKAEAHGRDQKSTWDFAGLLKAWREERIHKLEKQSFSLVYFCPLNSPRLAAAGKKVAVFKRTFSLLFSRVGQGNMAERLVLALLQKTWDRKGAGLVHDVKGEFSPLCY